MMSCRITDSHQNIKEKSFRIRHDDIKLFSRLLSRQETSSPSFRVYHADVSVPFVWESRPGTPKHGFSDDAVLSPPLTPPPSYYNNKMTKNPSKKLSRSNLLRALLMKISLKRTKSLAAPLSPSPSSSLSPSFSSSSSSHSSLSATATPSSFHGGRTRRFSGSGASFDRGIEDISGAESSAMCCGIINKERSISMKKVSFSIVGRRES